MTRNNTRILQSVTDYAKYLYNVLMCTLSKQGQHSASTVRLHTRLYRLDRMCKYSCVIIRILCYTYVHPVHPIALKKYSTNTVSLFSVQGVFNRVYNYLYEK